MWEERLGPLEREVIGELELFHARRFGERADSVLAPGAAPGGGGVEQGHGLSLCKRRARAVYLGETAHCSQ